MMPGKLIAVASLLALVDSGKVKVVMVDDPHSEPHHDIPTPSRFIQEAVYENPTPRGPRQRRKYQVRR